MSSFQDMIFKAGSVGSQVVKGVAVGSQAAFEIINSNSAISTFLNLPDRDNCSSGDEEKMEDEAFIAYGQRGTAVFLASLITNNQSREKTLHVDFLAGIVRVYGGGIVRQYQCTELSHLKRVSDVRVHFQTRLSKRLNPKIFEFISPDAATLFLKYITCLIDYGDVLRSSFKCIDPMNTGVISISNLQSAMASQDIEFTTSTLQSILDLSSQKRFDFSDFFHTLLGSPVGSLRDCLIELQQKATNNNQLSVAPQIAVESVASIFKDGASSSASLSSEDLFNSQPQVDGSDPSSRLVRTDENSFCKSEQLAPSLISGEKVLASFADVRWAITGESRLTSLKSGATFGTLLVTSYRLMLVSRRAIPAGKHRHSRYTTPAYFNLISVPLNSLLKTTSSTLIACSSSSKLQLPGFAVVTKDWRHVWIVFSSLQYRGAQTQQLDNVIQSINRLCFTRSSWDVFAFKHGARHAHAPPRGPKASPPGHARTDGWKYSNIVSDYQRMGLANDPEWQVFNNSSWAVAETYPMHLVVPSTLTLADLLAIAPYRSKNRIPVVTYRHAPTQTCLARSSQPLVGLTRHACGGDALLLEYYRKSGVINEARESDRPSSFYILDARGQLAAAANMAAGKGTEDVTFYNRTELIFCGIDNIHVMRSSFQAYCEALLPTVSTENDDAALSKIDASGWLVHCSKIIAAGVTAAEKIHLEGSSVLVHCSDGWDRTAQITSVAQVLLDPYYRTLEGFCVLVEKEWCSFGHKFHSRYGHAEPASSDPDERSPVFIQWLDVMHILLEQFESCFEYSMQLLVFVADHSHSGLFGNFFGNSERQRRENLNVTERTTSVWSYVMEHASLFSNATYEPYSSPLWPKHSPKHMTVWKRYYCRWDPDSHPTSFDNTQWQDDWGHGFEASLVGV